MYKLLPLLALTAVAGIATPVSVVAAPRLMAPLPASSAADTGVPQTTLVLVGGMNAGGMGGMAGGGMGGMSGGGVGGTNGGGMGGMAGGGMGGMNGGGMAGGGSPAYGGAARFGDTPSSSGYQWSDSSYASGGERQQYYHCIAQHGQCSVASSLGSLRPGASCTCLFGGRGRIK